MKRCFSFAASAIIGVFLLFEYTNATTLTFSNTPKISVPTLTEHDFTITSTPVVTPVTDSYTDRDLIVTFPTPGTKNEAQLSCSGTLHPSQPLTYESLTPTVATVNVTSGKVDWISNGTAELLAKTPWLTRSIKVAVSATLNPAYQFVEGSLGKAWTEVFLDRVTGATCTATCSASTCATCPKIQLFSTYNNATQTYVWDTSGWAADLDLTSGPVARGCVPSWGGEPTCPSANSAYTGMYTGVMVSPVHLLLGHTAPFPAGTNVVFVDKSNNVTIRTCGAGYSINAGLHMNILTAPIAPGIGVAKVLPANWSTIYAPGFAKATLPVLSTHQWHDASIHSAYAILGGHLEMRTPPVAGIIGQFFEYAVPGDSSTAYFAFIDGQTVAMTVLHHSYPDGPDLSKYINEINAAMTALGGGYQLQVVDLSGFPTY